MSSSNIDLDRLDLEEVKRFVRRRWRLVLGTAVSCAGLALGVCLALTPVYTSTSQVLLDPHRPHVFTQEAVAADAILDSSIVDSQIPIILSTRLLAKVVDKEHLADDPEFAPTGGPGLFARLFGTTHQADDALPSFDGVDPKLQPVIVRLLDKVDVLRVAKSNVISISVSSRDPGKAMRLADTLAATYVEDQVDVRAGAVQQTAAFFEQRLGNLRDQVRQSEQAVADYHKAHNLTTSTLDGRTSVGEQQVQSLSEQLALASTDTAEKLARYNQGLHFKRDGMGLDTLPEIIRSPVITQLRTQEADLTRRASDLSAMYGPAFPAITQMHAQVAGLDKAMTTEMKRLFMGIENDYKVAKAREDSLRKTIADLTDASGADNDVGVKLRELERTNLANKALFENFLNRAKITQEQSSFEEPDARLISPALQPTTPSSPKIKLIVPVAFLAGLIIGLGMGARLDIGRASGSIPARVAAPAAEANPFVFARIPEVAGPSGTGIGGTGIGGIGPDCVSVLEQSPTSAFAQSIDALANLIRASGNGRIVMLAPLGRGEGASTLALCVATSIGMSGKRVLLIDADPAGRGLSMATGCAGKPGLGDVITGNVPPGEAVVKRPNFAILPAGQAPLSPAHDTKRLSAFLADARTRFDLILVDAPAFQPSADTTALIALVDGVAIVSSWNSLWRDAHIGAINTAADQPNFLGIILNRTSSLKDDELAVAS